jgi:hypothetical protein
MCFGPSAAEKAAAKAQRQSAEEEKRAALEERAVQKREDISDAVSSRTVRAGRRGGMGRRSLFTGSIGSGYASRF